MGRKVSPKVIRMGINRTWDSVWYAPKKDYSKVLAQDLRIREKVAESMKDAGIDSIKIKRSLNKMEILVYVARPGVAIGRGGEGIDLLQKELKRTTRMEVEIKVREVRKADLSARIVARGIADGIERRESKHESQTTNRRYNTKHVHIVYLLNHGHRQNFRTNA